MSRIDENTVSAENQLPKSSTVFYLGDQNAPRRLLILGNSITRHGPKADIGWHHDWGMAASAPERDYVHLIQQQLTDAGKQVLTMVRQASNWERALTQEDILNDFVTERDFAADVILYRLGENVPKDLDHDLFAKGLCDLIEFLCAAQTKVVFTSTVWDRDWLNAIIRALAEKRGEPYVDLTEVGTRDELMAIGLFAHRGVSLHPGDAGMRYIADHVMPDLLSRL